MLITTQDEFVDHGIDETLGLVIGNTGWSRPVGRDIVAVVGKCFGGEISQYTKRFAEAREVAVNKMVNQAEELGADGIVAMRLTTSPVMPNTFEVLAYGTAVKLRNGE
jgi:uncharacterized protein YbjQ (UPF0145 family)